MMTAVFNERVHFNGNDVKYSDASFIRNEIKNGTLKQHPAAKLIHKSNPSESEKAVDKSFSIPSSVTGPTSSGLYVPAGEVATLTISDDTYMDMITKNISFDIIINSSY